jgi:hypothetical protein
MNSPASDSPLFSSSTADRRVMASARGAIAQHRAEFSVLVNAALECADPLEAMALTRMAYEYAMFSHPGMLASPVLERLLNDTGRGLIPDAVRTGPEADARPPKVERVLHVASEVYESGGHGRVLERWIEHDRERVPTVLFINGDHPVPDSVVRAVAQRGGGFARISLRADTLTRARELRLLASRHDLVVLHIHNYEILVPLALADPVGRPPTILVNHSSHLMWSGVGCTDVVVSFSDLEAEMTVARRGVARERSLVMGLPSAPRTLPGRSQARAQLGLDPDGPVLLSMGATYKLHPVFEVAHRNLVSAALDALPQATVLLVGPRAEDRVVEPDPRVRVLGVVSDTSAVFAAADILIDSWPLTGGTTVIDAGDAGLTVVALADPPLPILSPPASALDGCVVRAADLQELRDRLSELWASPERRADLGRRSRAAVATHHGDGWSEQMESVVAAAVEHRGTAIPPAGPATEQITEWEAVILAQRTFETQNATLPTIYARNLDLLPAERRPQSVAEISARLDLARERAPKPPRVIAAPRIEQEDIVHTLERMRELIAGGTVVCGVILVAAELLDDAVALIEPAMASGTDIDIELQIGEHPAAIARPDDVVLAEEPESSANLARVAQLG